MINIINTLPFQVHGGGIGGGLASTIVSLLEFLEKLYGKTPPEMFSILMPGIGDMENLHPIFVHYPIAFITAYFIADLIGSIANKPQWRYVAGWMLYLGTIAAMFAVVAGLLAADSVEHGEDVHEIMERHEHFGIAILALSLFLSALRLMQWGVYSFKGKFLSLSLAGLLCLLLAMGADLGGIMVYKYGVAVDRPSIVNPVVEPSKAIQGNPAAPIQPGPPGHDHAGHTHSHGGHHHHHAH